MTLKTAQNYNGIDEVEFKNRADNLMKQTLKALQY